MTPASIRQFHILLRRLGAGDTEKEAILSGYGVASSKDLSPEQLSELCSLLREQLARQANEHPKEKTPLERARSRVKAAAGAYLAKAGHIKPSGWGITEWDKIMRLILRAAKADRFNDIPAAKLNSLYNAFLHGRHAMEEVDNITDEITGHTDK